ncbi:phage tail tube assembly chaperone [Fructilactobacillus sp. Tb1]|uniref:phage tail tube assembly chaperone n=1 Tax=Fructilactobacillus sp. Tb1 TaxID=3422304 RepID=UPI003D2E850D
MSEVTLRVRQLGLGKPLKVRASIDQTEQVSHLAKLMNDMNLRSNQRQIEALEDVDQKRIDDLNSELAATDDEDEKQQINKEIKIAELKHENKEFERSNDELDDQSKFFKESLELIKKILGLTKEQSEKLDKNKPNVYTLGNYIGYLQVRLVQGLSDEDVDKAIKETKLKEKAKNGGTDPKK